MLSTDPICFARTSTGQLAIPLRLAHGIEAVVIGVRARLLLFVGEWFLDLAAGINYLPTNNSNERLAILGQPYDAEKARAAFRREILSSPGISEVLEMTTSYDAVTRTLAVKWRARTAFGDTSADTLQVVL